MTVFNSFLQNAASIRTSQQVVDNQWDMKVIVGDRLAPPPQQFNYVLVGVGNPFIKLIGPSLYWNLQWFHWIQQMATAICAHELQLFHDQVTAGVQYDFPLVIDDIDHSHFTLRWVYFDGSMQFSFRLITVITSFSVIFL